MRIFFASMLALTACGTPLTDPNANPPPVGKLSVSGQASLETCSLCASPSTSGVSFQTPSALRIGVTAVELLRSVDDANPVRLNLGSSSLDLDLIEGGNIADMDLSDIPNGTYTHLGVVLDHIVFTAEATGHAFGLGAPGELTVDYALSDSDDRAQGDYEAKFSAMGITLTQFGEQPTDQPAPYPGALVDVTGGRYHVIVAFPDGPLSVDADRSNIVDVGMVFWAEDALGWFDRNEPGYTNGTLDLTDGADTETPAKMALRGFSLDVVSSPLN